MNIYAVYAVTDIDHVLFQRIAWIYLFHDLFGVVVKSAAQYLYPPVADLSVALVFLRCFQVPRSAPHMDIFALASRLRQLVLLIQIVRVSLRPVAITLQRAPVHDALPPQADHVLDRHAAVHNAMNMHPVIRVPADGP